MVPAPVYVVAVVCRRVAAPAPAPLADKKLDLWYDEQIVPPHARGDEAEGVLLAPNVGPVPGGLQALAAEVAQRGLGQRRVAELLGHCAGVKTEVKQRLSGLKSPPARGRGTACTRAHTSSNANKPSGSATANTNTHWDILALPGLDGEDGRGLEHIFAVTASTVTAVPSSQRPLNSWGFDRPGSVGGLTWTDGAPRHHDEQAGALAGLAPGGGGTGHRGYGRRALVGPHGGGAWRLG